MKQKIYICQYVNQNVLLWIRGKNHKKFCLVHVQWVFEFGTITYNPHTIKLQTAVKFTELLGPPWNRGWVGKVRKDGLSRITL